jgi:hypothetical protein
MLSMKSQIAWHPSGSMPNSKRNIRAFIYSSKFT